MRNVFDQDVDMRNGQDVINPNNVDDNQLGPFGNLEAQGFDEGLVIEDYRDARETGERKKKKFPIKKKRKAKETRVEDDMLTILLKDKDGFANIESLENYLRAKYVGMSDNQIKYYWNLYQSKSQTTRIPAARRLMTHTIEFKVFLTNHNMIGITNDRLSFLSIPLSALQQYRFPLPNNFDYTLDMLQSTFINLSTVQIANIEPLKFENQNECNEYYVQDYSNRLSTNFFNSTVGIIPEGLIFDQNNLQPETIFYDNGTKYICSRLFLGGNDTKRSIIYAETLNYAQITDILKNTVYLKKEKKVLQNGIKELTKKGGYYYFNFKEKVTDFCPSYLTFKKGDFEGVRSNLAYSYILDPEKLCDVIKRRNMNDLTAICGIRQFIYWENVIGSFELFEVLKTTSTVLDNRDNIYTKVYQFISNHKDVIFSWAKHYNGFRRICCSYYDSFSKKINVMKMEKLSHKTDEWLEEDIVLRGLPDYMNHLNEYQNLIRDHNEIAANFILINPTPVQIVKMIKRNCMQICDPNFAPATLIQDTRATGLIVFQCFCTGRIQMIPEFRSPFIFMTNLVGDLTVDVLGPRITELRNTADLILANDEKAKEIKEEAKNEGIAASMEALERTLKKLYGEDMGNAAIGIYRNMMNDPDKELNNNERLVMNMLNLRAP